MTEYEYGGPAVVFDMGTGLFKCGFSGEQSPKASFTPVVGRPRGMGVMVGMGQKDAYIGPEAQNKRGILTLKYPIDRGEVVNWDDLEKIWHHMFYIELRVAPEEQPLLMNMSVEQEKHIQIMFETFNVPKLYLQHDSVLQMVSAGKTSGCVVDLGAGRTRITGVYDNTSLSSSSLSFPFGGRDLTEMMMKSLNDSGCNLVTTAEREMCGTYKEKSCYVALDYDREILGHIQDESYELPDGEVVRVGKQRISCPECLLYPKMYMPELDHPGLIQAIHNVISGCDGAYSKYMYENVIVVGGSSLFKNLPERIRLDLERTSHGTHVGVVAPPTRANATWIGGSMVASSASFISSCISKEDYDEYGPTESLKRCRCLARKTNTAPVMRDIHASGDSILKAEASRMFHEIIKDLSNVSLCDTDLSTRLEHVGQMSIFLSNLLKNVSYELPKSLEIDPRYKKFLLEIALDWLNRDDQRAQVLCASTVFQRNQRVQLLTKSIDKNNIIIIKTLLNSGVRMDDVDGTGARPIDVVLSNNVDAVLDLALENEQQSTRLSELIIDVMCSTDNTVARRNNVIMKCIRPDNMPFVHVRADSDAMSNMIEITDKILQIDEFIKMTTRALNKRIHTGEDGGALAGQRDVLLDQLNDLAVKLHDMDVNDILVNYSNSVNDVLSSTVTIPSSRAFHRSVLDNKPLSVVLDTVFDSIKTVPSKTYVDLKRAALRAIAGLDLRSVIDVMTVQSESISNCMKIAIDNLNNRLTSVGTIVSKVMQCTSPLQMLILYSDK